MDVPSLHKKLLPNWSAGTVSKSLATPASLETIQNGFEKLEMKTKMRVLLSLLNFDSKSKGECIGPIRELLRHSADKGNSGEVRNATFKVARLDHRCQPTILYRRYYCFNRR